MTLRIGITSRQADLEYVARNKHHYVHALEALGATVVTLAPGAVAEPARAVADLDGVILSGGGDMHPRHYGEELAGAEVKEIDENLDALELDIIRTALEVRLGGLPLLGICRGMQVLNVALGGGLIQHLPHHRPSSRFVFRGHPVWVKGGSRLARALGVAGEIATNSYHHQGVDAARLAPGLQPVARAIHDPWLIEAYESPSHNWLIGVQWHPERWHELPDIHRQLFVDFLRACRACVNGDSDHEEIR